MLIHNTFVYKRMEEFRKNTSFMTVKTDERQGVFILLLPSDFNSMQGIDRIVAHTEITKLMTEFRAAGIPCQVGVFYE